MQHKYNARMGLLYNGVNKLAYKMQCRHPEGFIWYYNRINDERGYTCISGCGQKCNFNPEYFLCEGNVKPLDEPNTKATKTITFSKEGTKMGKGP